MCMAGWLDGWLDGWLAVWMAGWMAGWLVVMLPGIHMQAQSLAGMMSMAGIDGLADLCMRGFAHGCAIRFIREFINVMCGGRIHG